MEIKLEAVGSVREAEVGRGASGAYETLALIMVPDEDGSEPLMLGLPGR